RSSRARASPTPKRTRSSRRSSGASTSATRPPGRLGPSSFRGRPDDATRSLLMGLLASGTNPPTTPQGFLEQSVIHFVDTVKSGAPPLLHAAATGFNQGLVSSAGLAYDAFVAAPQMAAGVTATMLGRPDMAPNVQEGTAMFANAMDEAGYGGLIA